MSATSSRRGKVLPLLKDLFSSMSGIAVQDLDVQASLIDLGADSLFLVQATQAIQDRFGVKVPFRFLLEDNPTIDALVSYIEGQMPPEPALSATPAPQQTPTQAPSRAATPSPTRPPRVAAISGDVRHGSQLAEPTRTLRPAPEMEPAMPNRMIEQIVAQQLEIMAEQLDLLRNSNADEDDRPALEPSPAEERDSTAASQVSANDSPAYPAPQPFTAAITAPGMTDHEFKTATFVPYQPLRATPASGLNPRQQQHLDGLIARLTARTRGSKRLAQIGRAVLADSRGSAGFRMPLKELLYPLAVERAAGAQIWDVDGNDYIDLTMGFGALLFGHSPAFIAEALQAQIARGMQLGLESPLSNRAAALLCELTGMERATFCNSGTEAVMTALRLARTVTGRDMIALFAGAYHGFSDGVLVRDGTTLDGQMHSVPMAPGIPANVADNVLVLEYGAPESLEILKAHAHELAAVLVEPVQSRRPDLQPLVFLRELRALTEAGGAALIFDEVITGLRTHPAGAQGIFGIRADIATYGKTAGGGLPVGIIAGKAAYLDAIDGGMWSYGDASYPSAERTFFAGTFFKHPLTMAVVWAVLNQLKAGGTQLQEHLNQRTAQLVATLTEYFEQEGAPIRMVHFGSLFRFVFGQQVKYPELFFYHLLEQGVYVWEGRNCFLSTAHSDDDLERVVQAIQASVAAMRAGEFLPPRPSGMPTPGSGAAPIDRAAVALPAFSAGNGNASRLVEAGSASYTRPTSIAEKELWILTQMGEEANRAYNEPLAFRLRGSFDMSAVRRAIQQVIDRHESLRTTFAPDGDTARIAPWTIAIPLSDFTHQTVAEREEQSRRWLDDMARELFDLAEGPPVRVRVARLADDDHVLAITLHHIITDGWSNGVLITEIAELYSAARQGMAAKLPPPMQYYEYVCWREQREQATETAHDEAYWLAQFADPSPALALPSDRPRPPLQTYCGSRQSFTIDAELLRDLKALSARQGSTLFVILLSAFQVLLHRLADQDDLVVGTPMAGQLAVGGAHLIGYCVNMLPLRARLSGAPTFAEYAATVKRTLLDAHEHQAYPFGMLIRKLGLPRDPSRPPLVTVVFNMDRKPPAGPRFHDLSAEVIVNLPDTAKYDSTLNITQTDNELLVEWEYNLDLFDAETIRRWSGHFWTILQGISAQVNQAVSSLPLFTPTEIQELLLTWNGTPASYPQDRCAHELFEQQAAKMPDAIALVYENQQLSYEELNSRANQLAHYLRGWDVGPDVLVGICVERSLEMIVGLLGILKAGGAYVPLDPAYPAERLTFMLEDSGATVLITASDDGVDPLAWRDGDDLTEAQRVSEPAHHAMVVDLRADWPIIARHPRNNLDIPLAPDHLAYVIYTSGSTGKPKGVLVSHFNIARLFAATNEWFHFDADDVWTCFHSYAFDFSVWELWGALNYGGRLIIVSEWVRRAPDAFCALLQAQQVTVLNQTPSAFYRLMQVESSAPPVGRLALRYVIFGGEALDLPSLRPWFDRHGDRSPQLVNMYGITETTVHVTYRALTAADVRGASGSVIGRPLLDLQIYLLDQQFQPAPIGAAGELYVGGAGLARAYLNRPDLTAERFVPNPFGTLNDEDRTMKRPDSSFSVQRSAFGARLYKTGDLARFRANGEIEYLGRADHQIKIRGFRIELGEIEARLKDYPIVRDAVVIAREDGVGDQRLAAYLVPAYGSGPSPAKWELPGDHGASLVNELLVFLAVKLPDYMLPSAFVFLDALPLTPTGKLDRRALPMPEWSPTNLEERYIAPRTPTEQAFAEIWARALGLERVGIEDNFFAIGGDSIRGLRLLAETRTQGYQIGLQDLFRHQTIARLAAALRVVDPDVADAPRTAPFSLISPDDLALLPQDVEDAYPLTMLQAGMFYHMALTPDAPVYHNVNSLHLQGPFEATAMQTAIQYVVDHQPLLRTSFDLTTYSQPLQLVHRSARLMLGVTDLRHLSEEDRRQALESFVEQERLHRFDPARPPLVRFHTHHCTNETFQLTLTDFHQVIDGWSTATMLTDISTCYSHLIDGRTPPTQPPPSVAFRDYVFLEQQAVESEEAQRYWDRELRDLLPIKLPRWPSVPRRSADTHMSTQQFQIAPALFREAEQLAYASGTSLKTVLLAAYLKVLSVAAGRRDIVTGLVLDGRPEVAGSERVLGLYLNTLPFRLLIESSTWTELIRATFDAEVELLPFRRYPLAALQRRQLGQTLFETTFNFTYFHNVFEISRSGRINTVAITHSLNDTNYPLAITFVVTETMRGTDRTLKLQLRYDANQLTETQIERMVAYYLTALQRMITAPHSRHDAQPLLSPEEQQILIAWNTTAATYPQEQCIHALFAAQAARTPDAVALHMVNDEDRMMNEHASSFSVQRSAFSVQVTYRELDRRANQLARHLCALGVGPEVRVGLCLERGIELIVGLMGVLKAGGAYVPLDPDYPAERVAFMLEDSGAQALIISQAKDRRPQAAGPASAFSAQRSALQVIDLDADWPLIAQQPATSPDSRVGPDNLAYVIYTSGSTGAPKGVMIQHRSVVNLASALEQVVYAWHARRRLRVSLNGPLSFDTSVKQLVQLLYGHTLQIIPQALRFNGAALAAHMRRSALDVFDCTPAQLRLLLAESNNSAPELPEALLLGGEAIDAALWQQLVELESSACYNLYGPTECTVDATACTVAAHPASPTIGRPLANVQAYVLDRQMHPVPIGVPSELYLGGAGLARGYLSRPDLTAERFIPNPFALESEISSQESEDERQSAFPERSEGTNGEGFDSSFVVRRLSNAYRHPTLGSRLYKTGDLGRWLPDGTIEFLGRIDQQIKLRGFRIELGEIEVALTRHPGVRDAIVVMCEDSPGVRRLVAYIVPSDMLRAPTTGDSSHGAGASSLAAQLRSFLASRLPDYMIPSAFVLLDALPLTPNGKLDRAALPSAKLSRPELQTRFVAPRTSIEQRLASVWRQVLGLNQVGVLDNFFDLGGDSIISIQIVAKARQVGIRLTPRQVFERRTIAELAEVATNTDPQASQPELPHGTAPLTPIQQWFFEQMPDPRVWAQLLLVETPQPLAPSLVGLTVQHMLSHHDALRLRFVQAGAAWLQSIADLAPAPPVARIDLSALPAAAATAAVQAITNALKAHLDLSSGRLLQAALIERGQRQSHLLALITHALAMDGVSQRILVEDLQHAYAQLGRGEAVKLPPKTTPFKRWSERLAEYAQTAALRRELSYWTSLARTNVAHLPIDHTDGTNTLDSARTVTVALSTDDTNALLHDLPAFYQTKINDVLLTALARAFTRWTGERSLLLDLRGHGREPLFDDVDLSRTVGWFAAICPVLLDLGGAVQLEDALHVVKEQLRALPNHGIGYGLLRYLSGDASIAAQLRALPQAEVSFNYLGRLDQALTDALPLALASTNIDPANSLWGARYLLEVQGGVIDGQLRLAWKYSQNLHRRATVERLADSFMDELRGLIAGCRLPAPPVYNAADFSLAELSQSALDALVERLAKAAGDTNADGIPPHLEDIYPLSPIQEGMLFHTLYTPESGVYFQQSVYELTGDLIISALQRAWQQALDAHPVLRTAFVWAELDRPLQVVYQQARLPWVYDDWRDRTSAAQEADLALLLQQESGQGFDLAKPPLMRCTLIRLTDTTYRFIWSRHHLLLDGWATALLLEQVFTSYALFRRGMTPALAGSRPYREYIRWLSQQDVRLAEAFWRTYLQGITAPTPLAVDVLSAAQAADMPTYEQQEIHLSVAATSTLQGFVRQAQTTVNTVMQSAWALLLSRYSGEREVVFGVTVSGRPTDLEGADTMIGLFINSLPLRMRVPPDQTLLPWLQLLQSQNLDLRQYEYSSLVAIQGWSEAPRGIPLFESVIVFENYPIDASLRRSPADLELRTIQSFDRTNYALTLAVIPGDELGLRLSYQTHRFEAGTVRRMLEHCRTLLEGMIADPARCLWALPLLTETERRQLLVAWNDTQTTYPHAACLHEIVETQVERTPDAVAIVYDDQQLSYADLNRRANQLARRLRSYGVGLDVCVGVCMERAPDLVVALLAILKAGGAYVPFDPDYPAERLAFMADDTQATLLLTQQRFDNYLPSSDVRRIWLDDDWSFCAGESTANLCSNVTDLNLAYLLYTSGSTGRPKGVMIDHRAIRNRLLWAQERYNLKADDRVLQKTAFSFDVSIWEFFWPLISGAALVLAQPGGHQDPSYLVRLIAAQRITTLHFVPSMLQVFLDTPGLSACRSLRRVICSGEALAMELQARFFARMGVDPHNLYVELHNLYGPTEAAVDVTAWACTPTPHQRNVPIGQPIANTQIYVLDRHMNPAPIGVAGELSIGGVQLARGYLGRPDLTAERFVPNPFAGVEDRRSRMEDRAAGADKTPSAIRHPPSSESARLYKTGDLARWLPNGNIEFLGRIDHQVKLRGFRIELGEIEAVLGQHPFVREAVVLAREYSPADKRLVAYVAPTTNDERQTTNDGSGPSSLVTELRAFLKARLPEYMAPSAFVLLEALPLTANGKLDRKALPAPDGAHQLETAQYAAPRSEIERIIAEVWQELLRVAQVGIHDNFFDLGGHSLLAMQLASRLRQIFPVEVPLRRLFDRPTVAQAAEVIEELLIARIEALPEDEAERLAMNFLQ